jgi:hypothetical protein
MPGKKHSVSKQITEIDNFDKFVVWCTIHNFCAHEGTVPAVAILLVKFKESIYFKGGCSGFRGIVRDLSFRLKKTRTDRGVPSERHNT